jgi:hypothetical protein
VGTERCFLAFARLSEPRPSRLESEPLSNTTPSLDLQARLQAALRIVLSFN